MKKIAIKTLAVAVLLLTIESSSAWFWEDGNSCGISNEGIGCQSPNGACTAWVHDFGFPFIGDEYSITGHCYDSDSNGGEWLLGCMCS